MVNQAFAGTPAYRLYITAWKLGKGQNAEALPVWQVIPAWRYNSPGSLDTDWLAILAGCADYFNNTYPY